MTKRLVGMTAAVFCAMAIPTASMVGTSTAAAQTADPALTPPPAPVAPPKSASSGPSGTTAERPVPPAVDRAIARWVATDSRIEAALAQFALQQTKDPQVRGFAERMVKDHDQLSRQLQGFLAGGPQRASAPPSPNRSPAAGSPQGAPGPSAGARTSEAMSSSPAAPGMASAVPGAESEESPRGRVSGYRGSSAPRSTFEPGRLREAIGDRKLALFKQDFSPLQGEKFDKAYTGQQYVAHTQMLATLEVLSDRASPELRGVLESAQQTTKQHLEDARRIMDHLGMK